MQKNIEALEKADSEVFQDSSMSNREWLIHLFQWKCSSWIDQRHGVHQALFVKPGKAVKRFSISRHVVGGLWTNEGRKMLACERPSPTTHNRDMVHDLSIVCKKSLGKYFCAAIADAIWIWYEQLCVILALSFPRSPGQPVSHRLSQTQPGRLRRAQPVFSSQSYRRASHSLCRDSCQPALVASLAQTVIFLLDPILPLGLPPLPPTPRHPGCGGRETRNHKTQESRMSKSKVNHP